MGAYLSLFLVSFLASTIIPLSSEIFFCSAILLGHSPILCLVAASCGNCAGASFNFVLGRLGVNWLIEKVFKFDKSKLDLYERMQAKYVTLFLFVNWLPFIGDPITLYSGIVKVRFSLFALVVFSTRTMRYIVVYLLMNYLLRAHLL